MHLDVVVIVILHKRCQSPDGMYHDGKRWMGRRRRGCCDWLGLRRINVLQSMRRRSVRSIRMRDKAGKLVQSLRRINREMGDTESGVEDMIDGGRRPRWMRVRQGWSSHHGGRFHLHQHTIDVDEGEGWIAGSDLTLKAFMQPQEGVDLAPLILHSGLESDDPGLQSRNLGLRQVGEIETGGG
jgi:hypothetical protein